MSSQYCLFYEKYALDFADQYLKWLQITYILFVNTENRMSLRVQGIAQWESCAASFFSIPANILLLGKSLNCLYLSQFLTDFHFLKKHLNASVLPQFWSTHLTSSFNFKFFKTGRANSHCAMLKWRPLNYSGPCWLSGINVFPTGHFWGTLQRFSRILVPGP